MRVDGESADRRFGSEDGVDGLRCVEEILEARVGQEG
jgi:hypothetical protein